MKIPVWFPGEGYKTSDPHFRSIIPLLGKFDLNSMQDGGVARLGEWEITKGTDEYGRAVVTHVEQIGR